MRLSSTPKNFLKLEIYVEESSRDLLPTENTTLYSIKQNLEVIELSDISEVHKRSENLRGKIVVFEAYGVGKSVSVQESLEHSTSCGEDEFPIKDVCVNLVADVLLDGIVAWEGIPTSKEDLLLVIGASSFHQDRPEEDIIGRFRYTGKVLSTKEIEESLPEGLALMIVDREKIGEFNPENLSGEAEELINENRKEVESLVSYGNKSIDEPETTPEEEGGGGTIAQITESISRIIQGILGIFGL